MKKLLVAIAASLFATQALAVIANGPHDLSAANATSNYPGGLISSCQFCHAPHNVNTGVAGAPLWNRNAGTEVYDATEVYASTTLQGTVTLGANSLTCLSCHDGVSDMGATFTGSAGFAAATPMNLNFTTGPVKPVAVGSVAGANALRDDHPVGVAMIVDTDFETVGNATTAGVRFYGATNTVECGSCHDPHGTFDNVSGGASFLRTTTVGLCDACHLK